MGINLDLGFLMGIFTIPKRAGLARSEFFCNGLIILQNPVPSLRGKMVYRLMAHRLGFLEFLNHRCILVRRSENQNIGCVFGGSSHESRSTDIDLFNYYLWYYLWYFHWYFI